MKKGSTVLVQGSLEVQEYEGKDGKNHTSVKLIAGRVVSLSKKEGQANGAAATSNAAPKATSITDEDIPF